MDGPQVCPKCERARSPTEDACARCGLLAVRWGRFSEEGAPELGPEPVIDQLWAELQERWEQEEAHERFLEVSAGAGLLTRAAARYQAHLRRHPKEPRASWALERAVLWAERVHAAQSERERALASRWDGRRLGGLVALALSGAGLALLLRAGC